MKCFCHYLGAHKIMTLAFDVRRFRLIAQLDWWNFD